MSELRNILSLISGGSFKQADVKISKELKKQPNSAYYLALHALVLIKTNKKDEGLETARKVSKAATANRHVLDVLSRVFLACELAGDCVAMFEAVMRKEPLNADIAKLWYETMIDFDDIRGLLKAAMARQKLKNASDHTATFQTVFLMHYSIVSGLASDAELRLYPVLALRYLEKVPKPYDGPQEMYVQALALKMQPDKRAFVEYLQSDEVRAAESLDLDILLVDSLHELELWHDLYAECVWRLQRGTENFVYWHKLWEALKHFDNEKRTVSLSAVAGLVQAPATDRNTLLAKVYLASLEKDPAEMKSALRAYSAVFSQKRVFFDDIRPFLNDISGQDMVDIVAGLEPCASPQDTLIRSVNMAKIQHLLDPADINQVSQNVHRYLDSVPLLKGKDPKDYHSGDDFLVLAALTVLRQSDDSLSLYKAAVFLETAAKADPHQFQVRMWLVRVYCLLACYERAKGHYDRLTIKMLQQETFAHLVTSRVSTVYPDQSILQDHQDIYQQTSDFGQYLRYAHETATFSQLQGFHELAHKFRWSIQAELANLESVKIERITGSKRHVVGTDRRFVQGIDYDQYEDNRDYESIFDCDDSQNRRLAVTLNVGPRQGVQWIQCNHLKEQIIQASVAGDASLAALVQNLQDRLTSTNELTDAEKTCLDAVCKLGTLSLDKTKAQAYDQLTAALQGLAPNMALTNWEMVHQLFEYLELCAVVTGFVAKLNANKHQVKFDKAAVTALAKTAAETKAHIQGQVDILRQRQNKMHSTIRSELEAWAVEMGLEGGVASTICNDVQSVQDKVLVRAKKA